HTLRHLDGTAPVARLAHDLDLVVGLEDATQALAYHGVVVDQQHADLAHLSGPPPEPVCRLSRAAPALSPSLTSPRVGRCSRGRVGTSVEPRLARRAGLPALVHPQPLLGMAANHLLEDGGEALRVLADVLGGVARALDLEDGEHVHVVARPPALADDECRHDG